MGSVPQPGPLTFSFCLVTRLRRELSLRFTLVLLFLFSILAAPSSLLRRWGEMDEEGAVGPEGRAEPVLQVLPGIHLPGASLSYFTPSVTPDSSFLLSLTYHSTDIHRCLQSFRNLRDWVCRGQCDRVSTWPLDGHLRSARLGPFL